MMNKTLKGPMSTKTDVGPGWLSKEAESTDFHERMHTLGYILLTGLPNTTANTHEMDQVYGILKREWDRSTFRVANINMAERVGALKKAANAPTIKDLE